MSNFGRWYSRWQGWMAEFWTAFLINWELRRRPGFLSYELQQRIFDWSLILKKFFIYLSIFDCAGSSLLSGIFFSCSEWGQLSSCGAWASHWGGPHIAEHDLRGIQALAVSACGLSSCSSRALEHRVNSCGAGFSCFVAHGILLDQRSNPCLLHQQADSLPLSHEENPGLIFNSDWVLWISGCLCCYIKVSE